MEAKELRIGNWVNDGNCNFIVEESFFILLSLNLQLIKPIQLTEEILLKCGSYWESIISEKDCLVLDVNENISIGWCGYLFLIIDSVVIQIKDSNSNYLHEIQNLYYALKGEDLAIDL